MLAKIRMFQKSPYKITVYNNYCIPDTKSQHGTYIHVYGIPQTCPYNFKYITKPVLCFCVPTGTSNRISPMASYE